MEPLIAKWKASANPPDAKEICKRLLDLFLVSVLLDAGAGSLWEYHDQDTGQKFSRSEGLGVASINMFANGLFSGDSEQPYRVDRQFHPIHSNPCYSDYILQRLGCHDLRPRR